METPHTENPQADSDISDTGARRFAYLRGLSLSWLTVGLFAILIAYADGFWFTSLQGAVGAISRSQEPFHSWWRDSTIMLPLIAVGVVVGLALTRRWFAHSRWKLAASVALVVAITTGVGVAQLTASAAYDYHLQAQQLTFLHSSHVHDTIASASGTAPADTPGTCNMLCSAKRQTLLAHLRGIKLASFKMLLTNMVLVLWVLAIRGGQLWLPKRSARRTLDDARSSVPSGAVLA